MKIGIGISTQADIRSAAKEALNQAQVKIGAGKINLAILFTSVEFAVPALLRAIKADLGKVPLAGCTTHAVITNQGIHRHAIALILFAYEGMNVTISSVKDIKAKTALAAGEELGNNLLREFGAQHRELGMIFCDGLIEEGSKLISGLQERLGKSFPIVGASASDNLRFYKTYLYFNQEILSDAAVGILLGGRLNFGLGTKHGWKPLGKFRTVTSCGGNVIEKIDDEPASKIYQDYFDKDLSQLKKEIKYISTLYPVGIYLTGEKEYLLRNVLSVEDNGSLVCQGDAPLGGQIRLMIGAEESCLLAVRQAAEEAKQGLVSSRLGLSKKEVTADIALVFDSVSRYTLLGRSAIKELKIINESMGEGVALAGIYTYGEQAPLKATTYRGQAHFHNQTVSILTLGG